MSGLKTEFSPCVNGFKFENNFRPGIECVVFGKILGSLFSIGLCGGMYFAALDRFHQSRHTETRTDTPGFQDRLFLELFIKQIATFTKGVWYKVFLWQASPDNDENQRVKSVSSRTKEVWPSIQNSIDKGVPVTLCLICVKGFWKNPAKNHQVIACHYEERKSGITIRVYDPNHPGVFQKIDLVMKERNVLIKYSSPFLNPVRGFFPVMH
ncbi:hypothetical protein JXA84_09985 [candidate division WOR-3 bacterium]|nr:hypothetical protein [candidate division WOR-3 bacterium]